MQKILIALSFVFAVVSAAAFSNGGFESTTCNVWWFCTDFGSSWISPWTVTSGSIDLVNYQYWQPSEGQWSVDMSGEGAGSISQSFDTVAGNEYHVSFSLSGNPEGGSQTKGLYVGASGSAAQYYTYNTAGNSDSNMNYAAQTYTFTAASSSSSLSFSSANFDPFGPVIDGVSMTSFTPAQVCAQWSFTNPGYFCGTNGGGFYTCMNGPWAPLSSWQSCPSGTTCWCDYGVECSNGGTESPCRSTNSH